LVEEENINKTRLMTIHVINLEKQRLSLEERLGKHVHLLSTLVENPLPEKKPHDYKDEHGQLEMGMSEFLKDFRKVKKEVFQLTEEVMETEKARHLLMR
jgi:hypothetical protein